MRQQKGAQKPEPCLETAWLTALIPGGCGVPKLSILS